MGQPAAGWLEPLDWIEEDEFDEALPACRQVFEPNAARGRARVERAWFGRTSREFPRERPPGLEGA
jgi:hypothetical protein